MDWDDPKGYDKPQDPVYQTDEVFFYLDQYLAGGKPVFIIDYTLDHAAQVYSAAKERGYIPYCSRTSLSRLTTTPPPGYGQPTDNSALAKFWTLY